MKKLNLPKPRLHIFVCIHERSVQSQKNCCGPKVSIDELKELKIEMIDRFGPLPEPTQNLFESSSLKNYSKEIGVLKINIYDDKAEITLNKKNIIDTKKIINLIQTKPIQFQLKNQNTLVVKEAMEADESRIRKIDSILRRLI